MTALSRPVKVAVLVPLLLAAHVPIRIGPVGLARGLMVT